MSGPKGGAPLGSANASKEFKLAIRRALAHRAAEMGEGMTARDALDTLAKKLVTLAEMGEAWAMKEIADRLDGKPSQQVQLTGGEDDDGNPLAVPPIQITFVNGTDPNTTA